MRILLAGTTGASDLYWYVPANSSVKSFKDTEGKSVAYFDHGCIHSSDGIGADQNISMSRRVRLRPELRPLP